MLQNGKKEHKMHQVKMLPWDKMSQFMGKISHKTHQDKF
jgi:menaquinone-dependent protoporphyrinogen IX oxidase